MSWALLLGRVRQPNARAKQKTDRFKNFSQTLLVTANLFEVSQSARFSFVQGQVRDHLPEINQQKKKK